MKTKALTAAQIDMLAQRLSETPIDPATSAKKAGNNFARLLAARIGDERAALAFTSIMALLMAWMPPPDGIEMCQCDDC